MGRLSRVRKSLSRNVKRHAILDAAVEFIVKRGSSHFTMDQIAEYCRIAKGSIYYYFRSRDELVAALLQEAWSQFLAVVESVPANGNPADTFLDTLSALVTNYNRDPPYLAALYILSHAGTSLPARLTAASEKIKARAYSVIEGRLRAAFPDKDPARLMREIGGLLFGLLRLSGDREPVPVQRVREAVLRLIGP